MKHKEIKITIRTCCMVLEPSSLKINSPGPIRAESVIFKSKSLKPMEAIVRKEREPAVGLVVSL
jgi:hypothetical protein